MRQFYAAMTTRAEWGLSPMYDSIARILGQSDVLQALSIKVSQFGEVPVASIPIADRSQDLENNSVRPSVWRREFDLGFHSLRSFLRFSR